MCSANVFFVWNEHLKQQRRFDGNISLTHAIGDPLLGAVDDVVFPVWGLGCGGAETRDVGAGEGFGDGEAHEFLAGEAFVRDAVAERGVVGPLPDCCQRYHHPREVAVLEAAGIGSGEFLRHDHVAEVVEVFPGDVVEQFASFHVFAGAQPGGEEVVRGHLVDQLLRYVCSVGFLRLCFGLNVLVDELPDMFS